MKLQDEIFKQSICIPPSVTVTPPQGVVSLLLGFKNIPRDEKTARNKAALPQLAEGSMVMMVEVGGGGWYCPVAVFCSVRGRFQAQRNCSICGVRGPADLGDLCLRSSMTPTQQAQFFFFLSR